MIHKLKSVTPNMSAGECENAFHEIARDLTENYEIRSGDKKYRLLEIEFYYYNPGIDDSRDDTKNKRVTYPRTCRAGQWFFHSSGIDITFESHEAAGYGGGILIRKIIDEQGNITEGSLKCEWELFPEYNDAFSETSPNPHIVKARHINRTLVWTKRYNLNDTDKRNWRCIVDFSK